MFTELRRSAGCAAVALPLFLAACSGASAPPAATSQLPMTQAQARAQTHIAQRLGSTVVASMRLPSGPAPHAWLSERAKSGKNLLYVSAFNSNYVDIYDTKGSNQAPIGTITAGLSGPEGMAVDKSLNLYVTNTDNSTVTVYPPGSTSPTVTYSQGVNEPAGVCIGKDGTVYIVNLAGTVAEYAKGSTSPERTLNLGNLPIDAALDTQNNLYVTFGDGVEEYAPGSTTGTNLDIPIENPGAIQLDNGANLVVANQTLPGVEVFAQGTHSPSNTFAQTGDPNPIRFDKKAKNLYVGDPLSNIVDVYAYPSGTLVNTISNGVSFDAGVAVSPGDKF
jgi:sugar lactone lactonase YvrE